MQDVDKLENDIPLCVDLDGTLIKSDILIESFFALIKRNPLLALLVPLWLLKGKAHLKQQIAARTELDVSTLPFHSDFLEYLRGQHGDGRRLILATASNGKFAEQVAAYLGLFEAVLASDESTNLSANKKLRRLREHYGDKLFDYAGNARADLKIWPHARKAILVNPETGVQAAAQRIGNVEHCFDDRRATPGNYLRALRPHQWSKNVLVFVPLLASHQIGNPFLLWSATLAFLAFSLCASSVYLINDLLDLPADRRHARKKHRPFASGAIPLLNGALLIPLLLVAAFGIALLLPAEFLLLLTGYFILTATYSLWLKSKVLFDVMVLAGLYTLRIIAGAAAISVEPSFWLLAFSMFLFLSLAMVKRYTELDGLKESGRASIRERGYQAADLHTLNSLGSSSGYLAVLVLALYINSDDVTRIYRHPQLIWLLCPILLYWVSRLWLAAARGKMHDDPVVFAFRDNVSRWIALMAVVIVVLAS